MKLGPLLLAGIISAVMGMPALAAPPPGKPPVKPGKPPIGAPGPIAGAGLAFLAVGGGYLVLRFRKRKQDSAE